MLSKKGTEGVCGGVIYTQAQELSGKSVLSLGIAINW